jgi:hypothetical protein
MLSRHHGETTPHTTSFLLLPRAHRFRLVVTQEGRERRVAVTVDLEEGRERRVAPTTGAPAAAANGGGSGARKEATQSRWDEGRDVGDCWKAYFF